MQLFYFATSSSRLQFSDPCAIRRRRLTIGISGVELVPLDGYILVAARVVEAAFGDVVEGPKLATVVDMLVALMGAVFDVVASGVGVDRVLPAVEPVFNASGPSGLSEDRDAGDESECQNYLHY